MRIAPLVTALLTAALVVTGCDGPQQAGAPVTGDGAPDGQGGTAALEFRLVLRESPAVVSGPGLGSPRNVDEARESRQSDDDAVQRETLASLDCAADDPMRAPGATLADRPLVACAADGTEKFLLDATTLTGEDVTRAVAEQSQQAGGDWVVTIDFGDTGSTAWAELTEDAVGKRVAFTIRGAVHSAPLVQQVITDGRTQISGDFSRSDAEDLVRQITGG